MAGARPWLPIGLPILFALLSLPLALRWIGPNPLYGYRTAASLSSVTEWYRANELAGWIGVAFSLAALLINLLLIERRKAAEGRPVQPWAVTVVAVLGAAFTAFAING